MPQNLLLEIQTGKHKGRKIRLTDRETMIGRGEDSKIRIGSSDVSRHHCILVAQENSLLVRDLQSRNGTFINGRPVEGEMELLAGGTLSVGPMMFQFIGDPTAETPKPEVKITIQSPAQLADSLSDDDIASWLTENQLDGATESDTAVFDSPPPAALYESASPPDDASPISQLKPKRREYKTVAEEAQDIIRRHKESLLDQPPQET
ncbi:Glycogen accumulation regulator GarA [Thalassoglobus neptunius]|uniref:Glycogen accumulation regulator GarA n=1 Tax=Thalassoglobus neptunius TaxID=1938619 RepID=A0A5C5X146_9PLAN|nr:FHA domain-containing protein [Thalassoglobus neptunius]TWT56676.1 Glycogen accumulation regulator GarA [Thalassoglobus neptunius]